MTITDPAGVGTADARERVQDAVDEFARWTGRDGVCVAEVRLVDEVPGDRHSDGRILYGPGRIELDAQAGTSSNTVRHELCHAFDLAEGRPSHAHPALFSSDPLVYDPDGDWNAGPLTARAEGFAVACATGPLQADAELLFAACASPRDVAVPRFVLDEVYRGPWQREFDLIDLVTSREEIAGLPVDATFAGSPVAGEDSIYVPAIDALEDGSETLTFFRVDADTAAVVAILAGPTVPLGGSWSLLGGDDDPLLVVLGGGVSSWRLAGDLLVPSEFPASATAVGRGALAGGAAWVDAAFDDEGRALVRIDLDTLAVSSVTLPDLDGGPDDTLRAGAGALATPWLAAWEGWRVAQLDATDASWTVVEWPAPLAPTVAVPLADGRILARWSGVVGGVLIAGLGVYDPQTDRWAIDQGACGRERTNTSADLVLLRGRPYLFEWADLDVDAVHASHGLLAIEWP